MVGLDKLNETPEQRVAINNAHGRLCQTELKLMKSGVSLKQVANLTHSSPDEFARLISSLTVDQTVLLRDLLKALLSLAEASGGGEAVLSTISSSALKMASVDTGLVSFLHDLIDIDICVKKLESNAVARSSGKPHLAEDLRHFKEQVERGAGVVAGKFVA